MAVLPIKTFPDPMLSRVCRQVNEVDDDLKQLSQDMLDTMYAAPGVGLAAPQVGRDLRLVVIDCTPRDQEPQPLVLFNPRIVEMEGQVVFEEGCLSVPDFTSDVTRAERVVVKAMDAEGRPITVEGSGLMAICLQHELDHLEGRLFLDRISPLKRSLYKKRRLKQIKRGDE